MYLLKYNAIIFFFLLLKYYLSLIIKIICMLLFQILYIVWNMDVINLTMPNVSLFFLIVSRDHKNIDVIYIYIV